MNSSSRCDGGVPAWLRLTASVVLATLLACADVPVVVDQPGYRLVTDEIWSGGDLMLVSPSFQGIRATVRVVIDGDTFPTVFRRADTVVFRPTTVRSGTYRMTVLPSVRPADDAEDLVSVRGFAACYLGPPMTGYALPWPEPYRLSTFVADGAESAIIVDAATGGSRLAVPPEAHFPGLGMGPGWAYEPLSVVLSGGESESTCMWRLEPSPERGECVLHFYSSYTLALLGPGKWVFATHHYTYRLFGPDGHSTHYLEEPNGLAASPRGDYVIVSGARDDGQLLIPAADNEPVVRIPSLYRSEAPAAFTPDGDTVYMAGWQERGDPMVSLVVFDARSPAHVIATANLGTAWVGDLAVDPVAPYLYILAGYYGTITVLDRATLRPVGTLHPDGGCASPGIARRLRLARSFSVLYVIGSRALRSTGPNHPTPTSWISRYDLLSPAGGP